jgi:hypothetical protein
MKQELDVLTVAVNAQQALEEPWISARSNDQIKNYDCCRKTG